MGSPRGRFSLDAVEDTILGLLRPGMTICPSQAARALADDWRPLMPEVRAAAYAMADRGELEVTQRGEPVGRDARGPIRLRLPR